MKTIIAILFFSFSGAMIAQTAKPLPKAVKQQAPNKKPRKDAEPAKPVEKSKSNPKVSQRVITEAPKKVMREIETK
jgi:hypothetical protein